MRVLIDVHGTGMSCDGETIVVNLHGALLRTSSQLELGSRITVHVQLTGNPQRRRLYLLALNNRWSLASDSIIRKTFGVFRCLLQTGQKRSPEQVRWRKFYLLKRAALNAALAPY